MLNSYFSLISVEAASIRMAIHSQGVSFPSAHGIDLDDTLFFD